MTDSTPWFRSKAGPEDRKHAPATLRNRDAILSILEDILPEAGTVLEIASGSGEHVCHFAANLPHLDFQPSDISQEACRSISAWASEAGLTNILKPREIDIEGVDNLARFEALLCINMIHIAPWSATLALFAFAKQCLPSGAPLYLYGPFIQPGVEMAEGNKAFDVSLRSRDPLWGLRNVSDVHNVAEKQGFRLVKTISMPANNLSLIFDRI